MKKPCKKDNVDTEAAEAKDLPSLWDVINNLGMGWFQLIVLFAGGSVFLVQGSNIQTITTTTTPLAEILDFSQGMSGTLNSLIYVGVLIGSFVGGYMGDIYGRRVPLYISFGMVGLVGILSSFALNYTHLVVLRVFFGIFYGMCTPAWSTLCTEVTPVAWRMVMSGCAQLYFQLGELYSIFMTRLHDPWMVGNHWKHQVILTSILTLAFFCVVVMLLEESPAFLAMSDQMDKAKKVLDRMRTLNRKPDEPIDFKPMAAEKAPTQTPRNAGGLFGRLFSRELRLTTLTIIFSHVVSNFVFFGNIYVFPHCFKHGTGAVVHSAMPDKDPVLRDLMLRHVYSPNLVPWTSADAAERFQVEFFRSEVTRSRHSAWQIDAYGGRTDKSPTTSLAVGVVTGEIPSVIVGATLGALLPRKVAFISNVFLMSAAMILFGHCTDMEELNANMWTLFMFSYGVIRFCANFRTIVLYQITAEIFPTAVRATGCALAFSIGHVGSISAAPLFEGIQSLGYGRFTYFMLGVILNMVNLIPFLWIRETKGVNVGEEGACKKDAKLK